MSSLDRVHVARISSLITAIFAFWFPAAVGGTRLTIGEKAPPLSLSIILQAPTATPPSWEDLQGQVVVLEFWASWCGPCVATVGHMNDLAASFRDKAVRFISITDEDSATVRRFLARKAMGGWVGLDRDGATTTAFGIDEIPRTVIVNQAGRIVAITRPEDIRSTHLERVLAGESPGLTQPDALADAPRVLAGAFPGDGTANLFELAIRPSSSVSSVTARGGAGRNERGASFGLTGTGYTVPRLLCAAYGVRSAQLVFETEISQDRYDVVIKLPADHVTLVQQMLQQAIRATLDLVGTKEMRKTDVYLLRASKAGATALRRVEFTGNNSVNANPGRWNGAGVSMQQVASGLEELLGRTVVDATALDGVYDVELSWEPSEDPSLEAIRVVHAARDQLGLELDSARRKIDVLVVRRASAGDLNKGLRKNN